MVRKPNDEPASPRAERSSTESADLAGPLRVLVLHGGDSPERDVSLASGARAAEALTEAGHRVRLVDPAVVPLEAMDFAAIDVCFLALHGGSGEDGRMQRRLERLGVAYTGSGPAASRAAMRKSSAKRLFQRADLPTPPWRRVEARAHGDCRVVALHGPVTEEIAALGFPVVVKPDSQGSSLGVGVARSMAELGALVAEAAGYGRVVLVERFIAGREMTVTVLGRQALPIIEIVPPGGVFDYHAKYYDVAVKYHLDPDLPPMKVDEIQRTALAATEALGTAGLARVDLMLDRREQPWVLEVNTLPGLTDHSLAPMAAAAAGWSMPALCDWMVRDAMARFAARRDADETRASHRVDAPHGARPAAGEARAAARARRPERRQP